MASPLKGSNHIQPPDHEGPSYGDCLERGRGHITLIGKELATDAVLNKVLCVCSGCRPIKACADCLADKCPSRSVVSAESGMDFSQELPPFLFGDASLEHSGRAFLIGFPLVDRAFLGLPK